MERSSPQRPDREGRHDGLAYSLWLPDSADGSAPAPGVVVVHGASSRKENHADFARLAAANGWAALTFDLPGHGESERRIARRKACDTQDSDRILRESVRYMA